MNRVHVIQEFLHIDKRLVRRCVTEPLNAMCMRLMVKPVIFVLEEVIMEFAVWVRTYVRLKVGQNMLSYAHSSAISSRSVTKLTYLHLRSDVVI